MKNNYFAFALTAMFMFSCTAKNEQVAVNSETETVQLSAYEKSAQESQQKVPLPEFEDPELRSFATDYEKFINRNYEMYDREKTDRQQASELMEEYMSDAERYHKKMAEVIADAPEKDIENLQNYMLQKTEELNAFTEQTIKN